MPSRNVALLLLVLLVAHNSLFDFEKEGEGAAIAEQK